MWFHPTSNHVRVETWDLPQRVHNLKSFELFETICPQFVPPALLMQQDVAQTLAPLLNLLMETIQVTPVFSQQFSLESAVLQYSKFGHHFSHRRSALQLRPHITFPRKRCAASAAAASTRSRSGEAICPGERLG